MAVKLIIFCFTFFCYQITCSQEILDFKFIEEKTYYYYQQGKWDSLIYLGEKALSNNIDYFYLRARIGYAYFVKGYYTRSIVHLLKAREYNNDDVFVFEVLYYAYLYSNQISEANYLLKNNKALKEKSSIKEPVIRTIYSEVNFSDLGNKKQKIEDNLKNNTKWYQANDIHFIRYYATGFQFCPNKYMVSNISYAHLNMDITRIVGIANFTIEDRFPLYQHQIYFNTFFRIKRGWYFIPAFNWVMVDYETVNSVYNKQEQKVLLWREKYFINNFAAFAALKHRHQKIEWDFYSSISNLNNSLHQLLGVSLNYYPKGNLNLYFLGNANILMNKNNLFIVEEKVGIKIFSKMWFEQQFAFGKMSNYVENYAYVIHNTKDISNTRIGASLIFPFTKFRLSVRYQTLLKSSPYDYYINSLKTAKYDYLEQSLFFNFTWWL